MEIEIYFEFQSPTGYGPIGKEWDPEIWDEESKSSDSAGFWT